MAALATRTTAQSGSDTLARFAGITIWKHGHQCVQHKPLLILYALGGWQQGLADVTFLEAEPSLTDLLPRFGSQWKSDHNVRPFWRLQIDAAWTVRSPSR